MPDQLRVALITWVCGRVPHDEGHFVMEQSGYSRYLKRCQLKNGEVRVEYNSHQRDFFCIHSLQPSGIIMHLLYLPIVKTS